MNILTVWWDPWAWTDHYTLQAFILNAVLVILAIELVRVARGIIKWRRGEEWVEETTNIDISDPYLMKVQMLKEATKEVDVKDVAKVLNVSYELAIREAEELLAHGLITAKTSNKNHMKIVATRKGTLFVEVYEEMVDLIIDPRVIRHRLGKEE